MASKAAKDALSLWDIHCATAESATLHNQTRRFLDPQWTGLCNDEVPLRKFVERMAQGETVLGMLKKDTESLRPFVHWLSALRLVP